MTSHPFDPGLRRRIHDNLRSFERRSAAKGELVPAAVAIAVVGSADGEASFILTRRTSKLKTHSGQWALPGGRIDAGESASETALREIEEEVGLALEPSQILGLLDDFPTRSGFCITPVVVWGNERPELVPDPKEVESVHLVAFRELDAPEIPLIMRDARTDRPLLCLPMRSLSSTVFAPTAAILYQMREVALYARPSRVDHYEQPRFAWS